MNPPSKKLPALLNGKGNLSLENTAVGRTKVALKPGRSLMDWIRLTHASQDLAQTGGKTVVVTMEELQKHNSVDDAWICLNGSVYNISPYLEYHPGGAEELMRGAGRDATDLFNQIHRWVNAESMLKKCFIGPMKASMWLRPERASLKVKKDEKGVDELDSTNVDSSETKTLEPNISWDDRKEHFCIIIDSIQETVKNHHVIVDIVDCNLSITLNFEKCVYNCAIKLEGPVVDNYNMDLDDKSGSVTITLPKVVEEIWFDLVSRLSMSNLLVPADKIDKTYRACTLITKASVNYNTTLFSFRLPSGSLMHVPTGHHVHAKVDINGEEVVRSYTPVVNSLSIPITDSSIDEGRHLHLMVKVYPDGIFTPMLDSCEIGKEILISGYTGNFSLEMIKECSLLIMLAAGTGITPMIKIIHFLSQSNEEKKMFLVFFNKTVKDILWQEELESLSKRDQRFSVCHILSEPEENWSGERGLIDKQLLEKLLSARTANTEFFFCVCGSPLFSEVAVRCLKELNYSSENIHAFTG